MSGGDWMVELVRDVLLLVLRVGGPVLVVGVIIGLVISLFQSLTSIQDQTLSFVPKILGMIVLALLLLPWMVGQLVRFTVEMFQLF
ncbi:MAG: flagellar biosynthetic protein FliQ [Phycisphaeraceae bacterium]|nr:flagellar biosynthetic protein FliQ [Phycisphaeraceae bacterium]